jgi:signal-transduction protein with cAMP-binding, CBS, and nucleotidyltransferase domain
VCGCLENPFDIDNKSTEANETTAVSCMLTTQTARVLTTQTTRVWGKLSTTDILSGKEQDSIIMMYPFFKLMNEYINYTTKLLFLSLL